MDAIQKNLLSEIMDLEIVPEGAYNIRANGESAERHTTANIDIVTKTDKPGIDIIIKPGTKNERVDIPVLLTKTGLKDLVYNDFYIGEDADVLIVAGCGIHNAGDEQTEHDGIHSFHVGKNAKLKYVEKHYGEGEGTGEKVLNPTTEIEIDEGGYMEMESAQLGGVDSTVRVTRAKLADRATLVIGEKIMTHGKQTAITDFTVDLDGENCGAHVVSRSVAKDESRQTFLSCINGNNLCSGHTECDAIIMDSARVDAIPKVAANHVQASLIHEAAIGKIAGEQLIKLMTLGLSEKQAEEQIINGFLR
ncbi:MAG: SufD family Fe-S cluster assembly protein [Clostridia bacterium]|nr:SufD family Fe-S cluster assembly protein [Clostridia bacterium]